MGDILPFVQRVRSSGDWTAGERARLEELAQRFAHMADKVEVVFGTSDDGDPWCVVKDENEDILVHVAKIGGRFVVHYALDDTVQEASELPAALGERLGWADAVDDDVVVPFSRQAQSFIALLIGAAFFYETSQAAASGEAPHAAPADLPPPSHAEAAPLDLDAHDERREAASHAVALNTDPPSADARPSAALAPINAAPSAAHATLAAAAEAAPAKVLATAVAAAPAASPVMAMAEPVKPVALTLVHGTSGDDRLVGGAGSDHLIGGAGNDTLVGGGAPKGGFDLLDGGAGDDRIEMGARVFALGGKGADTFVLTADHMGDANQRLGVILDFHLADGDRLVTVSGQTATVLATTETRVAVPFNAADHNNQPQSLVYVDGQRVTVDLDGDHQADGYVVLADPHGGHAPAEPDTPAASSEEPPPVLTGHGLDHELF